MASSCANSAVQILEPINLEDSGAEKEIDEDSLDTSAIQGLIKSNVLTIIPHGTRSAVWEHFGRVHYPKKHKDLKFVACKTCFAGYKIDESSASTGNLVIHLKKHNISIGKRSTNAESGASSSKLGPMDSYFSPKSLTKAHSERIHSEVLKFCIDRCLPFEAACSESMAGVINACLKTDSLENAERDKVFKLCDESTLRKNRLPKKYAKIMETLKTKVATECCGSGGVTIDLWSDKYHKREYLSVTLQYLNDDFEMQSYCLACRRVTDNVIDHFAIARLVSSILSAFNLNPANMTFVTDSGGNVKKACFVKKWNRIACFAHDLHLLVAIDGLALKAKKKSTGTVTDEDPTDLDDLVELESGEPGDLPQIRELIKACRGLVDYFKRGNGQRR